MNKYLEKIAGNRLIRHIAENRENFPLSRLLGLAEKGVLKSPEQLLPGRNLGAVKQLESIASRHKLKVAPGDIDLNAPQSVGTLRLQNRLLEGGNYGAFSRMSMDGRERYANMFVPPLYKPTKGDQVANIRGLHSTHVHNHEAFEVDEAFKAMRDGRSDIMYGNVVRGKDYTVAGHNNASVLLRESRDMSSNPYAHISPPATNFVKAKSAAKAAQKLGVDVRDLIDSNRAVAVDASSALPALRANLKEDKFVSILMRGRPYQSNPTSSEINRARNLKEGQGQALYDTVRDDNYSRLDKVRHLNSVLRGNSAYRN